MSETMFGKIIRKTPKHWGEDFFIEIPDDQGRDYEMTETEFMVYVSAHSRKFLPGFFQKL